MASVLYGGYNSVNESLNMELHNNRTDLPAFPTADVNESNPVSALYIFRTWYEHYHGHASVIVCICGMIMNLFNIIVLTQRKMRTTSNMILAALAVSDMLTMASYIPFALQFYILHGLSVSPERNCLEWIYFFLFHVNFSVTVHTISIWLCVLLAVFRYSYVRVSADKKFIINMQHTFVAIVLVYILSVIILIPNYLSLTIIAGTDPVSNKSLYDIVSVDTQGANSPLSRYGHLITSINFWTHAILIKIIPCVLMSVFGFLLVWTMHVAKQKCKKLRKASKAINLANGVKARHRQKSKDHNRTTSMLVVVILLFLMTELPQGILALMSGLIEGFFEDYYMPLGDLMDIIALINNSINFILYCSMSKQFRDTFLLIFCRCCSTTPVKPNNTAQTGMGVSTYSKVSQL